MLLALALFVLPWLNVLVIAEAAVAADAALVPSPPASVSPSTATLTSPDAACETASNAWSLLLVWPND